MAAPIVRRMTVGVDGALASAVIDSPATRKARGAFFTPEPITRFITEWAIRDASDRVLEPSAGDAAFLVQAVKRLSQLGAARGAFPTRPEVTGVEIHADSASIAKERIRAAGGDPIITVSDFFLVDPDPAYTAVIGNPPYIRYQDFTGDSRARSRAAALRAGVPLSGLASSWAAFTIHSALFIKPGGRLGLVLPAELLSVNYASVVRRFLFSRFRQVDLVLFDERVFPEAETEVVLLLAEGFDEGPTDHATIFQARNEHDLASLGGSRRWVPADPGGKWTSSTVSSHAMSVADALIDQGHFVDLESWGDTTLGMVTGNNKYFALSPRRVAELGLERSDLVRLSPPGSSHLRGLALSDDAMTRLGRKGMATWLFRPSGEPSAAARAYIAAGEIAGVDQAYKCRVRKPWWRVPLVAPADLLLTYMNADTPRLTTNSAGARHLNSVHGVYLRPELRDLGRELLPIASLNSATLFGAELVGRSYGGGILKLEPREADQWAMPSYSMIVGQADKLRQVRPRLATLLRYGQLAEAVRIVDSILLREGLKMSDTDLAGIRAGHAGLTARRVARSESGK